MIRLKTVATEPADALDSPLTAGIGLALAGLLFVLIYYPTFITLVEYWGTNDTYSYGFLVPVISGYLVWMSRDQLRRVPRIPNLSLGTAVLGGGLAMLLAGRLSHTNLIDELSLIVTLCGATLLIFGTRMLRSLAFPMAYLLAMIPFWDFITNRLHPFFQLYSAAFGVAALRLFGVPVLLRNGIFIELPNITLEVADVCSGVNNLIAVLCIGVPLTYSFVKGWGRRLVIVASAVLIALLSNGIRVAMVSLFAYHGIAGENGDIHGPFSLLRTVAISGVGFLVLFWLISRFAENGSTFACSAPSQDTNVAPGPAPTSRRAALIVTTVLALFFGFDRWHVVSAVPLRASLVAFPTTIGHWQSGSGGSFSGDLTSVDFDDTLSRNYTDPDGTELNLSLGYFENQRQGRELVGHGVRSVLSGHHTVYKTTAGHRVKDFLRTTGPDTFHVTYWYTLDGQIASEDFMAKLFTAWDSLAHGRSNGAVLVVKMKVPERESIEHARLRVRDFVDGLAFATLDYLPQRNAD